MTALSIGPQVTEGPELSIMYRVVYIVGQGYGWMTPEGYAGVPDSFRGHVLTLAYCTEPEYARLLFEALPQGWYACANVGRVRWSPQRTEAVVLAACHKKGLPLAEVLRQMSEAGQQYVEDASNER